MRSYGGTQNVPIADMAGAYYKRHSFLTLKKLIFVLPAPLSLKKAFSLRVHFLVMRAQNYSPAFGSNTNAYTNTQARMVPLTRIVLDFRSTTEHAQK